jgi:hypothetical protein
MNTDIILLNRKKNIVLSPDSLIRFGLQINAFNFGDYVELSALKKL